MDDNSLLFLLRGGHYNMSDRIKMGLWPHPPLKLSEVIDCLARAVESETWFPYEWKPAAGEPVREGGIIERQSSSSYIYRSYRHSATDPKILAEQSEEVFSSSQAVALYYLKWDLHLPGDLDGWQVIE